MFPSPHVILFDLEQALEEEIEGLKAELVNAEAANDELNLELQDLQERELSRCQNYSSSPTSSHLISSHTSRSIVPCFRSTPTKQKRLGMGEGARDKELEGWEGRGGEGMVSLLMFEPMTICFLSHADADAGEETYRSCSNMSCLPSNTA